MQKHTHAIADDKAKTMALILLTTDRRCHTSLRGTFLASFLLDLIHGSSESCCREFFSQQGKDPNKKHSGYENGTRRSAVEVNTGASITTTTIDHFLIAALFIN